MSRLCSGCADTVGISMSFPRVASKSCRFESAHFFRLSLVMFTAMVLLVFRRVLYSKRCSWFVSVVRVRGPWSVVRGSCSWFVVRVVGHARGPFLLSSRFTDHGSRTTVRVVGHARVRFFCHPD